MLPEEDITRLEMNIADGMKLIISGGAVNAKSKNWRRRIDQKPESS